MAIARSLGPLIKIKNFSNFVYTEYSVHTQVMSKHFNDPALLEQVAKLETQQITRNQAAETLGISLSALNSKLARSGLNQRLKGVRNYSGDNFFKPNPDKAKVRLYEQAVSEVLAGLKPKEVCRRNPTLNYTYLCAKVQAVRVKADPAYAHALEVKAKVRELHKAKYGTLNLYK